MPEDFEFSLIAAEGEDSCSPNYQDQLHEVEARTRELGSPFYDQSHYRFGAVLMPYFNEFIGKVLQPAAITGLAGLVGAWLQAQHGRKARIKVGYIEVEANTTEEIEKLLNQAQAIKLSTEPKHIYER